MNVILQECRTSRYDAEDIYIPGSDGAHTTLTWPNKVRLSVTLPEFKQEIFNLVDT